MKACTMTKDSDWVCPRQWALLLPTNKYVTINVFAQHHCYSWRDRITGKWCVARLTKDYH